MEQRRLGRTGVKTGVIGLGTEYLLGTRNEVTEIVARAIERGVNYFDLLFNFPDYVANLGAAFAGKREHLIIAGHLGSAERDGQYCRTRNVSQCRELFHDLLRGLQTDYVDGIFVHNMDEDEDLAQILAPGGLLELAQKLKDQGKARFIGLSGHTISTTLKAISTGMFDAVMHPVNMDWDGAPGRKDLFRQCLKQNIGLVGMKPYAGGELLKDAMDRFMPVKCLAYSLSNLGVATVVPGVSNLDQLEAALLYVDASDREKDFQPILAGFQRNSLGSCLYCNHCLPCPAGIDIADNIRLLDSQQGYNLAELTREYHGQETKASHCLGCGECSMRCPFKVDVAGKLRQAAEVFDG